MAVLNSRVVEMRLRPLPGTMLVERRKNRTGGMRNPPAQRGKFRTTAKISRHRRLGDFASSATATGWVLLANGPEVALGIRLIVLNAKGCDRDALENYCTHHLDAPFWKTWMNRDEILAAIISIMFNQIYNVPYQTQLLN